MVGNLSGYWFGIICSGQRYDWEDLIMGYKETGYGTIEFMPVDEELLSQMYPMVAANCKAFLAAHNDLALEMYRDPAAYAEEYNKAVKDFSERLLNETQLFARFFELQHRVGGIITYLQVHVDILRSINKKLQEKLDRYENND